MESGYGAGSFDKQWLIENMQIDSSLKMMTENFDKLLSVSGMNEKDQEEKDRKEMKMEKKPFKKFVSANKKKLRKVKDIPLAIALENKKSTFWSFQPKMHSDKNRNLNLEKIVGSSYDNQGILSKKTMASKLRQLEKVNQVVLMKRKQMSMRRRRRRTKRKNQCGSNI